MNNTLKFLFGIFVLCAAFASCNQKKDQAADESKDWYIDPRESMSMQRTMTDTLAVLYNAKKYLNFVKANELDSALSMLYQAAGDTVVPLSEAARKQMLRTYTMFPLRDYEIDRLHMFSETSSELHYTIKYGAEGDSLLNTMKCILQPVRVGYYWYLTVPKENRQQNPEIPLD